MRASAHHRVALFGSAIVLWFAAAAVKGVIRPAVSPDAPEWLRVALGSTPSLLGGLSVPLCFLAFHPRPGVPEVRRACLWALAIVVIAELIERHLQGSTFDWLDLAASVIGVAAAALVSFPLFRIGGYYGPGAEKF